MGWTVVALLLCAAVVLVRFLVFLRVLYRDGTLYPAELRTARGAQLPPLILLLLVLAAEILLIDRFGALIEWIPLIIGITVLAGALLVVERSRAAVLRRRAETGEE